MLYKLFSRLLYNRLHPLLDNQQSPDQAGFRQERSTIDHLFTASMLQEVSDEWRIPLWLAAVDFKKAFDSVTHVSIWEALSEQGTPAPYTQLLSRLYRNQTASVKTDRTSRKFTIARGTKQGDPLSSLLFNSVSEHIMRRVKRRWAPKSMGVCLELHTDDRLTNLRFADDILLVAGTLDHMKMMLGDLSTEAAITGLCLHPDKTKIMHNGHRPHRGKRPPGHVDVLGMSIEVLSPQQGTKYLGRKLQFSDSHSVEIENRIATAWRKFHALKQELTGRAYSLNSRLKLFNSTITPTILYGCEAWTTTAELERRIQKTQRQMLRMIIHVPRRMTNATKTTKIDLTTNTTPRHNTINDNDDDTHVAFTDSSNDTDTSVGEDVDSTPPSPTPKDEQDLPQAEMDESWTDWIRRSTHTAEACMRKLRIDDWKTMLRKCKWNWVQHLATTKACEWARAAILWTPERDLRYRTQRRIGRPKLRWVDDIRRYIHTILPNEVVDVSHLLRLAATPLWNELRQGFVDHSGNTHA